MINASDIKIGRRYRAFDWFCDGCDLILKDIAPDGIVSFKPSYMEGARGFIQIRISDFLKVIQSTIPDKTGDEQ